MSTSTPWAEVASIPYSGTALAMTLSPGGQRLAVLTKDEAEDEFRLLIIDTGPCRLGLTLPLGSDHCTNDPFCDAAWSPDGSRLAVAYWEWLDGPAVRVWIVDSATCRVLTDFSVNRPGTDGYGWSAFTGVRWSADAARIAVDFHGVKGPPDHWPFAVSIHDALDGDVIAEASWRPGPEGVLNSAMTHLYVPNVGDEGDLWIIDFDADEESTVPIGLGWATLRLSDDESKALVDFVDAGSSAVVDVRHRHVTHRTGLHDTASNPIGAWAVSQRHWIDTEAESADSNRSYRLDSARQVIAVLGRQDQPGPAMPSAATRSRRILLELPE
jgi:WD40 repeat protein